jgi:hypothetical protein
MSDLVDDPWSIGDLSSDVTDFSAFTSPENRRLSIAWIRRRPRASCSKHTKKQA